MKLRIHYEAKYDRRENNPGKLLPNDVVVKRGSVSADSADSLEAVMQQEGEQIFAHNLAASQGYCQRMEVTAIEVDGAMFKSPAPIKVGVKSKQSI